VCELKNRLEEIRKQHAIRQEDLAAALEVSRKPSAHLKMVDTIHQSFWPSKLQDTSE
jgi:transcriptional regulator with XRE-family HTH domain